MASSLDATDSGYGSDGIKLEQICLFGAASEAMATTVGPRGKVDESFQYCLGPLPMPASFSRKTAQGGVHPIEVSADHFRNYRVGGWIGCGLGQVGVSQLEDGLLDPSPA